jgi:hypothetical protein
VAKTRTSFKKGKEKTGGRVAGTPNKVDLKEATLRAFDEVGGCEYLKNIASKYPTAFLNFVGRFIAKDIQLSGGEEGNNPIRLFIEGYSDRNNKTSDTSTS